MVTTSATAQTTSYEKGKLDYSGRLAPWGRYTPDLPYNLWLGALYFPQLNYQKDFSNQQHLNIGASAKLSGMIGMIDSTTTDGDIVPYRVFVDYSTERLKLRAGLQNIRFGSAEMFRSVMWFDRTNPRDPLQMTDGVWGITGRCYFQGHINLWVWLLYGNKGPKGIDFFPTSQHVPEVGGRLQWVYPAANFAFSYHYHQLNTEDYSLYTNIPEHRFGLDALFDWPVGMTVEATSIHFSQPLDEYTHQSLGTLGFFHTFGFGMRANFEQFVSSLDEQTFAFNNTVTLSGLSLAYPVCKTDNLEFMFYYDWTHNRTYNYLQWKHQFRYFYVVGLAYWNPTVYESNMIAAIATQQMLGRGIQLMLVWEH